MTNLHLPLAVVVTVLFAFPSPSPATSQLIRPCAEPIPGHYIIGFAPDFPQRADHEGRIPPQAAANAAEALRLSYGGRLRHIYSSGLLGYAVADISDLVAARIASDPRVAFVETDCALHPTGITTQANPPWNLDRVDERYFPMDTVYEYDRTGWRAHAYVLDYLVFEAHEQFEGRVQSRTTCIGGQGCTAASASALPTHPHGTMVASVIGGKDFGVAKKVNLHSVEVCRFASGNQCKISDVTAGLAWVRDNGSRPAVINMSLNYEYCPPFKEITLTTQEDIALQVALVSVINSGVTVVLSAGNCGIDSCHAPPAQLSTAIKVSATDSTDTRWKDAGTSLEANYGSCVSLFAPGGGIGVATYSSYDTDIVDLDTTTSGTSFAAPHVVGLAALYLANNQTASPARVKSFILDYATGSSWSGTTPVVQNTQGSPNLLLFSVYGGNKE